jgi:hypothetical protein
VQLERSRGLIAESQEISLLCRLGTFIVRDALAAPHHVWKRIEGLRSPAA